MQVAFKVKHSEARET